MGSSLVSGHRMWSVVALCAVAVAAATGARPLAAQPLPPAATPGGALPHLPKAVPAQPSSKPLFHIPGVAQRPLGLTAGPRLVVRSFRITGAVERPKFGIHIADMQKILAAGLAKQPAKGFTVNQLQQLAGKIADYYHRKGFILAQSFVPAQEVHDGVVAVRVLEGKLGEVTVQGNRMYSARALLRPFNALIGGPVDKGTIESALLTLTNYPGLTAFGVLGAGQSVGTTHLTLRVQDEQRMSGQVSIDNQGSQYAGQYRAQVSLGFNDLLGIADQLQLYGLYGFDPADSSARGGYGGISYQAPVFSPRDSLLLSYATNEYDIGRVAQSLAATDPKGRSAIAEIGYRHDLAPSRLGSASLGAAFDVKRASFNQLGHARYQDNLTTAGVNFAWDRIDTRFRGINRMRVTYTHGFKNVLGAIGDYDLGSPTPPSRYGASGKFDKVALTAQRLQRITTNSSVLLRVRGQYSSDPLVSLAQLSLAGPDAVRAYPVADVLADKGVVGTVEFIVGAPGFANRPAFAGRTWGQVLQFSVFMDYAQGWLNGPLLTGTQDHYELGGWGGAIQLNIPGHVFARVDVATPTSGRAPSNGRDPQYFFRLGVSF